MYSKNTFDVEIISAGRITLPQELRSVHELVEGDHVRLQFIGKLVVERTSNPNPEEEVA